MFMENLLVQDGSVTLVVMVMNHPFSSAVQQYLGAPISASNHKTLEYFVGTVIITD